jgi:Protein of unknown function (DUF1566)
MFGADPLSEQFSLIQDRFRTSAGSHAIDTGIGMACRRSGVRLMSKPTEVAISTPRSNLHTPPSRRVSLCRALVISLLWFSAFSAFGVHGAIAGPSNGLAGADRWKNLGHGVLEDARTQLEWLQDDNGEDIDWNAAKTYCDRRRGGWRLPSLPELRTIYDEREEGVRCAETICKVSSEFHLTSAWLWSATQVGKDSTDGIELAWGLLLANGAQTQAVREAAYGSRVLCARGPL